MMEVFFLIENMFGWALLIKGSNYMRRYVYYTGIII